MNLTFHNNNNNYYYYYFTIIKCINPEVLCLIHNANSFELVGPF